MVACSPLPKAWLAGICRRIAFFGSASLFRAIKKLPMVRGGKLAATLACQSTFMGILAQASIGISNFCSALVVVMAV